MLRRIFIILIAIVAGVQISAAPLPSLSTAIAAQEQPVVAELLLGYSTEGRPITALRVGTGPRALWLIGGTHGRPEANTYQLVLALQEHFRAHPEQVPPDVRLYFVPLINPDGLALQSRHNARDIDLNRNMNTSYDSCAENDWQPVIFGAYGQVLEAGGPAPESEVESILVREMLLGASAAIFYHSDGGVVFPASCDHQPSLALAQAYAQASGYGYTRYWENYLITGGMHDWAASLGIASIIPELLTGEEPDVEENLAAILAILDRSSELLPLPQPVQHQASGVEIQALIWRYWRSHGAEESFGLPISPAIEEHGTIIQYFEKARLELRLDRLEFLDAVTVTPDGRQLWARHLLNAPESPFQPR